MRVILKESQFNKLLINEIQNAISLDNHYDPVADGNTEHNPYQKKLDQSMDHIESFLKNNGRIMTNIDNGKDYLVYEILSFANLLGKRTVICQLIKDNMPFGSIYIKPWMLFKTKKTI